MAIQTLQRDFARVAAAVIVVAAMALTFEGTMRFCQQHGALGWRGALIAGMNDLVVVIGILWPQKPLQGLAGVCSIFTIWANLGHAASGAAGVAVALVPPVLAIALVASLEWVARRPTVDQVSQAPEPVVAHEPEPEPVVGQPEPTEESPVWDRETTLAHMKREGLTVAQMVSLTGIPKSTLNRWRRDAA